MVSIKEEIDIKIKKEYPDIKIKIEEPELDYLNRKDPTSFLPEEPMSYEIKEKKKKKKKKKQQEDPFKDIDVDTKMTYIEPSLELKMDPEVNIKAENIEVELDFNDVS